MIVYMNDTHGGMTAGFTVADKARVPYAIDTSDLNRDGHSDIVIGYLGAPGAVFFNRGDGKAFTEVRFGDGRGDAYGFALADLNGDGYRDIALARSGAPNVVYFSTK